MVLQSAPNMAWFVHFEVLEAYLHRAHSPSLLIVATGWTARRLLIGNNNFLLLFAHDDAFHCIKFSPGRLLLQLALIKANLLAESFL